MKCSKIKKMTPFLVSGELSQNQQKFVKSHLKTCGKCQFLFKEYKKLFEMVNSVEMPKEPLNFYDTFYQEIMQKVSQDSNRDKVKNAGRSSFELKPRFAIAGIAAFALIMFGILFFRQTDFSQLTRRQTLESYLLNFDYTGLVQALQDSKHQTAIMKDSVRVDLLISTLQKIQRMDMRYGIAGRILTESLVNFKLVYKQDLAHSQKGKQSYSRRMLHSSEILTSGIDFKNVFKALNKLNQPGARVSIIDLIKMTTNENGEIR